MIIKKVKIVNFRNLQNVNVSFNDKINFIIGENNIGKSNFLDLLEIIFSPNKTFDEDDFKDINQPIECELTIELNNFEIGLFDDYTDPNTGSTLTLKFVQNNPEDKLECYFILEGTVQNKIDRKKLKCINFVKYVSVRIPERELKFEKSKGPGKFLNYLLKKILKENEATLENFVNQGTLENFRKELEDILNKLKFFNKFNLKVELPDDLERLIPLLFSLKEKNKEVSFSGHGVQFILTTILTIFEKIVNAVEKHQDCIWTDDNGNRFISVILALDEPEVHLHPYMQRSLIKYIQAIVNNHEQDFKEIISNLFELKEIFMQVFIVTHSPNILLDNYKQYIRFFYDDSGKLLIKSGNEICIDQRKEKHFYRNHLFVKEAFFSRCVILVEGDTEFGALPVWANILLGDIDMYGISIIKVDGKDSLKPVREILNAFGIANIIVADSDAQEDLEGEENIFITNYKDFEEEVVNTLWKLGRGGREIIFTILLEVGEYRDAIRSSQGINNVIERMEKEKIIEKFRNRKSYTFGQIVAEKMALIGCIPEVYKNAICEAQKLSKVDK